MNPADPSATLFEPLTLRRGPAMRNRFMLAPLTNSQSHDDGRLSDDEHRWLTMRARGGFGLTMTCASHVQATGRGFPGQLGCFGDEHLPGLTRLAADINATGSVSSLQLHHAGVRSPEELIGTAPVGPSADDKFGARALAAAEVEQLVEDFIAAAVRAEQAGFHGVELHGAHGYILCQFLSPESNRRDDAWGGSLDNRCRIFLQILDGIRARTGEQFQVGVRLSPERWGLVLEEVIETAQRLIDSGHVDYLDLSLWDCFKRPHGADEDAPLLAERLLGSLRRGDVRIGMAGQLYQPADIRRALALGADFAILGRMAILHHDYPDRLAADAGFVPVRPPVTADYLAREGLGDAFVGYMRRWKGFVEDAEDTGATDKAQAS